MKSRAEELVGKMSPLVEFPDGYFTGDELLIEDWHEVGATGEPSYQNSWTTTTNWHFGFRKLRMLNSVQIHGRLTPGTETDGTLIFTLPSTYYNASGDIYTYISTTDIAGGAGGRFYIDTSDGGFKIINADTSGTYYDVNIIFPLDV